VGALGAAGASPAAATITTATGAAPSTTDVAAANPARTPTTRIRAPPCPRPRHHRHGVAARHFTVACTPTSLAQSLLNRPGIGHACKRAWRRKGRRVVREATAAGFDPDRLRQIRVNAGVTQAELATATGTDPTTIAKYEGGARTPYVERFAALAAALGVTPADLTVTTGAGTLAELRTLAGLTQLGAATRAGLVRTTYSAIERGETPTIEEGTAQRIATALGITAQQVHTAHAASRRQRRG
jgi:transcriptional regulator with XRE-family HTH domain